MSNPAADDNDTARTTAAERGRDLRTQAAADEIAEHLIQQQADADQWALDKDQQASDSDQSLADREQRYADQDQAAANAELMHAHGTDAAKTLTESSEARDVTRRERNATEAKRTKTTTDRMIRANLRDTVARLRTLTDVGRERIRDQDSNGNHNSYPPTP